MGGWVRGGGAPGGGGPWGVPRSPPILQGQEGAEAAEEGAGGGTLRLGQGHGGALAPPVGEEDPADGSPLPPPPKVVGQGPEGPPQDGQDGGGGLPQEGGVGG